MFAGNGFRWRRWAWATLPALAVEALDRAPDRAVRGAPAEDQQVAAVRPEDLERRDVVGDPGDLRLAQQLHPVVVVRVVADVAGDVGLLEAADAVLQAGRARDGPLPGEGLRVALVRVERPRCSVQFVDGDVRQVVDVRDLPRLGAGGEERVGQVDDRRHVLQGEPPRLDREVEALAGRRRGDDRQRRVAVPAEHHLEQVGLLVLRRHAGRRAGALDVDDDERQLDHDREAEGLRLQGDARARTRRSGPARRRSSRRWRRRSRRSRPRPGTS